MTTDIKYEPLSCFIELVVLYTDSGFEERYTLAYDEESRIDDFRQEVQDFVDKAHTMCMPAATITWVYHPHEIDYDECSCWQYDRHRIDIYSQETELMQ